MSFRASRATTIVLILFALSASALFVTKATAQGAESKKAKEETPAAGGTNPVSKAGPGEVASAAEDPDLPRFLRGIDTAEYIRLRDEHIARLRGAEPGKPLDPTARQKAIKQMEQQESLRSAIRATAAATLAFPTWQELGPNPIPNGQTNPVNPLSGRVTAIEIDPTDPNKVYVGAAQGGVYRSLDGGATWTPIFDRANSLAIGALALDAANARLYVGTGESNSSADSFAGVGLYRIDNVNTTATLTGPINPVRNYTAGDGVTPVSNPVFNGRSISRILIVPNDPTTLFVSTASGVIGIGASSAFGGLIPPLGIRGIYRLSNGTGAPAGVGVTRIGVRPGFTSAGGDGCFDTPCTGNRSVNDMVFDPGDPTGNTLIVWLNGFNAVNDGGVWRSTNAMAGAPAFTQTFATTDSVTFDRGSLAIYKQGANPAVVYVATGEPVTATGTSCTDINQFGALRVSTNGGVTFGAKLLGGGGFCGGQCSYDIGLDVNPGPTTGQGDDIVYLGGNVRGVDNLGATTNCERLAGKSTDGGATFTESATSGVHADTHAIRIAPSNPSIIYRGDDGGIFKSVDAGVTWTSLNNSTFRATQFQSIAIHPTDPNFSIGGTQDNGTNNLLASGTSWNRIDYGDGGFAQIDQNAIDTTNVVMYHTYFNQTNNLIGFSRVLNTTCAADNNWAFKGIYPGSVYTVPYCDGSQDTFNGITIGDSVLFYAPLVLGPNATDSSGKNTVYFGSDRLYRSANRGDTMTVVSQAPLVAGTPNIPISNIAVSLLDDNYRIVGLANGALFYTTTGSSTLTVLDPTTGLAGDVIPNRYVARIVFDPSNKNTAYVALGGYMGGTTASSSHVWKVTNLGTAPVIAAINGSGIMGLPDVPVNGFAIDPLKTTRLFAGTDIGVYDSEDGGATWSPLGAGLPRVAVFDMAVQNVKRVLRIATHGRGMWEIGLPGPGTLIVNPPTNVVAAATTSTNIQVTWTAAASSVSYQVWRSSNNGAYAQVGTSTATVFPDTVSPNTTYLYQVKAVDASANVSPYSNMDFATTVMFTNDPLAPGVVIQGVHLTELRTAVSAMLAARGLTTTFTDPTVNSSLNVKAVHVTELRGNLNTARNALGVPALLFKNGTLTPSSTVVKAIDFQEIRDGVK